MLVSANNIGKSFGVDIVLEGLSFRIDRREKVALVGRNGSGKTTLLKILTRDLEPDSGSLSWAKGVTVGYLSQHSSLQESLTVIEQAEAARGHLVEIEKRLALLSKVIEEKPSADELEEFSMLQEHFILEGGYALERDVRTVLAKMGFDEHEFDKPVSALSGGERTRLSLARLLLEEPEILILDEPTNHLDLEATEWLENWLRAYGGAVLLVSHDRVFLQNVAERVLELQDGATRSYPGPFDKFLRLRAEDRARQAEMAVRQQEQIDKLDEFVRRFMNSQRTAQARGRQKLMQRLIDQRLEAPKSQRGIKAGFSDVKRGGEIVVQCKDLSMNFGLQKLFQHLDWTVRWSERWGLIGANGSGKSTLLKLILSELSPIQGTAKLGSNALPGYFSQDASDLDLELSPLEMLNQDCGLELGPARNLLGRFLITGDDVFRPARTLSGGERNKLMLAMLTALNPNLLVLDEPTNHLDMDSREALAEVLNDFKGTLILVSHDRWLLDRVVSLTLDLRGDGTAIQFPGSYSEYRVSKSQLTASRQPLAANRQPPTDNHLNSLNPRDLSKEIDRLSKDVKLAEQWVHQKEVELEMLEASMASPPAGEELFALSKRHAELQGEIQTALDRWVSLAEDLEDLRNRQANLSR